MRSQRKRQDKHEVTVRDQVRGRRRGKERYKERREGGEKGRARQYAQAGPTKEKKEVQETNDKEEPS